VQHLPGERQEILPVGRDFSDILVYTIYFPRMPSKDFQKKMYGRYKRVMPRTLHMTEPHETPWYRLGKEESTENGYRSYLQMGPAKNRFRHIKHPGNVTRAVRSEISRVIHLHDPKPAGFFGSFVRYAVTSAAIFAGLLVAFNFQAYGSVISYWWMNAFSGEAFAKEAFAYVEHTAPTLLPLPQTAEQAQSGPISLHPDGSQLPINPPDNRIMIPKIGQNIPIKEVDPKNLLDQKWSGLEEDIQEALKDGVVRYPGTALPGQNGNVFVTGHSSYYLWDPGRYKDVFALLHELAIGDTITVFYDENRFDYKVTEIKVVSPHEVDVLQQTNDKRITLMTCTPIGTAINRLVVIAQQVE